jgi:biopolymer transport protein ExbD
MKILLGIVGLLLVLGCARVIAGENFDEGSGLMREPTPSEHDVVVKVKWSETEKQGTIEIDRRVFTAPKDILETMRAKVAADPATRAILCPGNAVPPEYGKEIAAVFREAGVTKVAVSTRDLNLPVAKDRAPAESPGEKLDIRVTWSAEKGTESIEIEGRKFATGDEIVDVLRAKVKERAGLRILIRADRNVRYAYLKQVMVAAGKAGVGKVTFSVVDNTSPVPAAKQ